MEVLMRGQFLVVRRLFNALLDKHFTATLGTGLVTLMLLSSGCAPASGASLAGAQNTDSGTPTPPSAPTTPPAKLPDDSQREEAPPASSVSNAGSVARGKFVEPAYSAVQLQQALSKYSYVDPNAMIPKNILAKALTYYDLNLAQISSSNVLSIVDFSQYSGHARFFVINMKTGAVAAIHVAHGANSDPNRSGYATRFSNAISSDESSLGVYMTAETYTGKHGLSLRLDGLSATNSNVRARAVVLHGASYVQDANVNQGRSWGCLAVPMPDRDKMVSLLKGGSIIFADLSGVK
jgi:hypothetical protein